MEPLVWQIGDSRPPCMCRIASVEAQTRLICLTLRRDVFVEILGPLEQLMTREKSPQVITQRLLKLQTKGTPTHMPAEVTIQLDLPLLTSILSVQVQSASTAQTHKYFCLYMCIGMESIV